MNESVKVCRTHGRVIYAILSGLDLSSNGSQLKNLDISGAIFTLSLSIRTLNSQCVDGARDVRIL